MYISLNIETTELNKIWLKESPVQNSKPRTNTYLVIWNIKSSLKNRQESIFFVLKWCPILPADGSN